MTALPNESHRKWPGMPNVWAEWAWLVYRLAERRWRRTAPGR